MIEYFIFLEVAKEGISRGGGGGGGGELDGEVVVWEEGD